MSGSSKGRLQCEGFSLTLDARISIHWPRDGFERGMEHHRREGERFVEELKKLRPKIEKALAAIDGLVLGASDDPMTFSVEAGGTRVLIVELHVVKGPKAQAEAVITKVAKAFFRGRFSAP